MLRLSGNAFHSYGIDAHAACALRCYDRTCAHFRIHPSLLSKWNKFRAKILAAAGDQHMARIESDSAAPFFFFFFFFSLFILNGSAFHSYGLGCSCLRSVCSAMLR